MSTFSQDSFQIRPVSPEDLPELLAMIRELADFERLTHLVTATEADYHESLFGETPAAEALLAEENGRPVGYAVYFSTFSTFVGRAGVWLEDLYVRPDHRGKGYGKALLKAVGRSRTNEGRVAMSGRCSTGTSRRSISTSGPEVKFSRNGAS